MCKAKPKISVSSDDSESKAKRIKKKSGPSIIHLILLNKTLRVLITMILISVLAPSAVYMIFFSREIIYTIDRYGGTCAHSPIHHVPCGEIFSNEEACLLRDCCYSEETGCFHYLPSRFQYRFMENSSVDVTLKAIRKKTPQDYSTVELIKLSFVEISDYQLKIILWNPMLHESEIYESHAINPEYTYTIMQAELLMMIEIKRNATNDILLSTSRGPLIVSDNFFEWSFYLGTEILYGLGEIHLKPGKIILFNTKNDYKFPIIYAYCEISDKYHGIKFSADAPIEVEILPSYLIIIRSMNGASFSFDLYTGSTPIDVLNQINNITDYNHDLPPFWVYGIHLCRSPDNIKKSLERINIILEESSLENIPFDSDCVQDNYLWFHNLTSVTDEVFDIIETLKTHNKKILFPISLTQMATGDEYDIARSKNLLITKSNASTPHQGILRDENIVYVDWMGDAINTEEWIYNILKNLNLFRSDGYTFVSNFLTDETSSVDRDLPSEDFSFIPEWWKNVTKNLVAWNNKLTNDKPLIYSYNIFGSEQMEVIYKVMQNNFKSPVIFTNEYSQSRNMIILMKNIKPTWDNLNKYVKDIIVASMSGIQLIGGPVCGDSYQKNIDEELCLKWFQVASLMPIVQLYDNNWPTIFSRTIMNVIIRLIKRRYSLLEYYNTLYYLNQPIITPVFFHYPYLGNETEIQTKDQMLIGNALLAAPNLESKTFQKKIYFPIKYYEIWGGKQMPIGWTNLLIVKYDLPLFIKAGSIVPIRKISNSLNAEEFRMNPLMLLVALDCNLNAKNVTNCEAKGNLIISYAIQWNFYATHENIKLDIIYNQQEDLNIICDTTKELTNYYEIIKIYGMPNNENNYLQVNVEFDICLTNKTSHTFHYNK